MNTKYFTTLSLCFVCAMQANAQAACNVKQQQLLGAWQSQNGFFEQMAFEINGKQKTFNSWLHERPDVSNATWRLNKCQLNITPQFAGQMAFQYQVSIKKNQLLLKDTADGTVSVYIRLKS